MTGFDKLRSTRRRLLGWLGVLGGGLIAGPGCEQEAAESGVAPLAGEEQDPRATRLLNRAIRQQFSYLTIETKVIEAFARDLSRHQGPWHPKKSPPPFTRFLASTDFFQNGADESRPLRYVTYYDPYVSTCYNPFESST